MINEAILLPVSPYYITVKKIKRKKRKGKGNKSIAAHENTNGKVLAASGGPRALGGQLP